MARIGTLFIVLTISGCASSPYPVSSPYFQIPAGSNLVLKQSLRLLPNSGRVYIQYGKVVSNKEKDPYYPHCWFVSWDVSDSEKIIHPGNFVVTASRKDEYYVNRQQPALLASTNLSSLSNVSFSASAIEYSTVLTIHSDTQENIRQFICSHWEDPADAQHLTVLQINNVLGEIAELKLP